MAWQLGMNDPSQGDVAIAALFATLVEALDEKSNGLSLAFTRHLEEAKARLRENPADHRGALATLSLTATFLSDDLDRSEPACVVYAKTWRTEEAPLPSSEKIQLPTLDEAVRFWARLPLYDQEHATVETASGHRFDAVAVSKLAKRYRDRPLA